MDLGDHKPPLSAARTKFSEQKTLDAAPDLATGAFFGGAGGMDRSAR